MEAKFLLKANHAFLNNENMKKVIIIISLVVSLLHAYGQNRSILDSTKTWNIGHYVVNDDPRNPYEKWYTTYLIVRDNIIINGKNYKKIFDCNDSLFNIKNLRYYIREDSSEKIFLADNQEEICAFDFSLEVGDSLILNYLGDSSDKNKILFQVDSIKTITLMDNKQYSAQFLTIYNFYNNQKEPGMLPPDIWVKGIGSLNYGLIHPSFFITGGGPSSDLLCYSQNAQLIYQNPIYNNCTLNTSINDHSSNSNMVYIQNMNNGILRIERIDPNPGIFQLFTINGQKLSVSKLNETTTDLCPPGSGFLVYRYISNSGKIQTGRIIVK